MNAESEILHERTGRRPSETVAGFLSAVAIFMSAIGIVWHPLRLIVPSTAIALIAAAMAGPGRRLQYVAVLICAACLFLGLTLAVVSSRALW